MVTFTALIEKTTQLEIIRNTLSNSMLVTIVSYFDNFLLRTLKNIILSKEGLIELIENKIEYQDLTYCTNMEEVKRYYVDNYLSELMRDTHYKQIKWIDKSFKTEIEKSLKCFKDFLLLMELRNIIVHNDSKINKHFLNNLKNYGIKNEEKKYIEGNEIYINVDTFNKYLNVLIQAASNIFNILGNKYFAKSYKDCERIEYEINENIINYINKEEYILAKELIENVLITSKKISQSYKFILNINLALIYKNLKNTKKVKEILNDLDWSNCNNEYKYAKEILFENYTEAIKYMHMEEFINEDYKYFYMVWPLFKWFTKTKNFKNNYKKIFKEEYVEVKPSLKITVRELDKIKREIEKMKIKSETVKQKDTNKKLKIAAKS